MSRARTHGKPVSNVSSGDQYCPPSPRVYETTLRFEPPLASFFLTEVDGSWLSRALSAGQALARFGSRFSHVGVYVGNGRIVHADLAARRVVEEDFAARYDGRQVLWSDAPIQRHLASSWGAGEDEREVRQRVVEAARALIDAPYALLTYAAIAADVWKVPGRERLRLHVDLRGGVICSSMVDRAFEMAGVHLFTDDREPGYATPADLHLLDETWLRTRVADLESRVAEIERRIA